MNKDNSKNIIFFLMGVIIIILMILCVLFATDKIQFKTTTSNNSKKTNSNEITEETVKEQTDCVEPIPDIYKVYLGNFSNNNSSYSTTLILFSDNTFKKCDGNHECLSGQYSIDNNTYTFVTTPSEMYPTSITYIYNLETNNNEETLISANQDEYCNLKEID